MCERFDQALDGGGDPASEPSQCPTTMIAGQVLDIWAFNEQLRLEIGD